MLNRSYYNTVLSQTFSPCGKFLVAGDIYGQISVFNLDKIINPVDDNIAEYRKPRLKFESKNNQVCSLESTGKFLLSGGVGEINGWDWTTITKESKTIKTSWNIQIPNNGETLDKPDINVIKYDSVNNLIYAGCGNNNIYVFSMEDGKLMKTLEGHSDFIHWLHIHGTQMASASEDGTVKIWDLRENVAHNTITPSENERLRRSNLGKWIATAVFCDDWLVCGGGPRLALWHLRSLDVATVFPICDDGIHVAQFYEDRIMAGGTSTSFYQFNFNGDICAEIPSSSPTVYSVAVQDSPKALCIAGSSPKIDLCTNFNYRDQILTLE